MKFVLSALLLVIPASLALAQKPVPVPAKDGVVYLGPANSRIGFVGTHEGAKPDPRQGGFKKFTGTASLNQSGALQSVAFDIETSSLWTEIPKLSSHLKSPDFFSVRDHPMATFRSTSITPTRQRGVYRVKGKFTLLGVTKEISIPATVGADKNGITFVSRFTFDRTQFGMTYGQGKVHKDVSISMVIGEATAD